MQEPSPPLQVDWEVSGGDVEWGVTASAAESGMWPKAVVPSP